MARIWTIAVVAFLAWLLGITGVYPAASWVHLLLVIAVAFALTGLLWTRSER